MAETSGSHGVIIKVGDGATPTEAFTAIPLVEDVDGPGWEPEMIEAKTHDSLAKHRKPAGANTVPVGFSMLYDSTNVQQKALIDAAAACEKLNFQMIIPDAGAEQYAFGAYVKATYKGAVSGFNEYAISLEIDGDITVS